MSKPTQAWLRGPIVGIAPMLQPVAHCLIASSEEVHETIATLPADRIWARPKNSTSMGFHVRHGMGSLDRLFTYARGKALSAEQLAVLAGEPSLVDGPAGVELAAEFDAAVQRALGQLRATDEATLLEPREVGRAKLPSTVLGLLFHGAEHTQRHVGQMKTTFKVIGG